MPQNAMRKSVFWVISLTILIFTVDIMTPQGVNVATLYVGTILVTLSSRNSRIIIGTLMLSTLLTVLGYFISPASIEPWKSVLNRSFSIIILWIVAYVGFKRIEVQENLFTSEERYRNTLDNLIEGAQIIGYDWRYLYVNESVAKQGHQTRENLLGRTMMEMYPGIEHTKAFEALKDCMQNRKPHLMENEFTYPDGTKGWFELSIQPIQEGIFILSNDITERKQAEYVLSKLNLELEQRIQERTIELKTANEYLQDELILRREAEAQYRALFNQSNDAVFLLDLQGNHVLVNQSACDILGYTEEELKKLSYKDISAEIEQINEIMKRLLSGELVPVFERMFRKKSGEVFPVEINVELVRDDFGNPIHIQSIVRDITERKRIEEIIRHQNKMLSKLHEITLDLLKQDDLLQLLQKIVDLSAEFLDAEHGGLMLVEDEVLVVKAVTENLKHLLGTPVRKDAGAVSWQTFESTQPVVVSEYSQAKYSEDVPNQFALHASAGFPIISEEKCIGVLSFGRTKPNYDFTEEQIQFGKLFANLSALVIENVQLRETLHEQSIHDSLTGLFNRRYMEETLKQEISRAARQNHPLGIIMIDIDHFKNFNDSFGHQAGDSLLSQLGQFLQTNIRAEDIACRYGGEEFILIMPDAQLETVQKRAEQVCEEVKKIKLQGINQEITLSLGVAMYPQHGKNMDEVIHAADQALYQAKRNGRNQVVVAKDNSN
jgi:diguanylate cyclase (GGDEF)-like protein/PAS domain S-box-containing protein